MAEELESEIREVFGDVGIVKQVGFSMPVNLTTQETLGHCFVEFNSKEEAEVARNKRDGYKFGDCKLSVSLYDPFGSLAAITNMETYPETTASFRGSSRYPELHSLLSPVREEDEESVYSDVSTASDRNEILMWSDQENDMSCEEFS